MRVMGISAYLGYFISVSDDGSVRVVDTNNGQQIEVETFGNTAKKQKFLVPLNDRNLIAISDSLGNV
jgi:hypothetical protein